MRCSTRCSTAPEHRTWSCSIRARGYAEPSPISIRTRSSRQYEPRPTPVSSWVAGPPSRCGSADRGSIQFTGASASVKGYPNSACFALGEIRAARARAEHGARARAAGGSRRTLRHRRWNRERCPRPRPRRVAGPGRDRRNLPARPSTAAQRVDLGDRAEAVGRETSEFRAGTGCAGADERARRARIPDFRAANRSR